MMGSPSDYILADVRSAMERAQVHVREDVWLPLAELPFGWQEMDFPRTAIVVLYCDCPNAEALYASVLLAEAGLGGGHILVLEEGLPGWRAQGGPVVTGDDPCPHLEWLVACQSPPPDALPSPSSGATCLRLFHGV
jgi:rhodanese-related sulfurtransferase